MTEQLEYRQGDDAERDLSYVAKNYRTVTDTLHEALKSVGRAEIDTTVMAAIKSADVEEIRYLVETLGVRDLGENRVQQLMSRYDELKALPARLHFIGSLQTNKVKYIIDKVEMIHSCDSLRLAKEIDKQAEKHGIVMKVLAEINIGEEESKGGILLRDAEEFCVAVDAFPHLRLCGVMTMAPRLEHREEYREYFRKTREEAVRIFRDVLHREDAPILSMGMSESYPEAAMEGATIVRVGRMLFAKDET